MFCQVDQISLVSMRPDRLSEIQIIHFEALMAAR